MKRWQIYLLGWLLVLSVPGMVMGEPCDARPRWLAVTVVAGLLLNAEDPARNLELGGGARLLDRCSRPRAVGHS